MGLRALPMGGFRVHLGMTKPSSGFSNFSKCPFQLHFTQLRVLPAWTANIPQRNRHMDLGFTVKHKGRPTRTTPNSYIPKSDHTRKLQHAMLRTLNSSTTQKPRNIATPAIRATRTPPSFSGRKELGIHLAMLRCGIEP